MLKLSSLHFSLFLFFKTVYFCVALVVLELPLYTMLAQTHREPPASAF